jgi:hypothetical protein
MEKGSTIDHKFHIGRQRAKKGLNICSACHARRDRGMQRYCKACHAAYMRENRPKHSELTPEQRMKANARSYAHVYRDRGKIDRKPCEKCGSEDSQMHHEDYSRPLEVTWLCRDCHLEHHKMAETA